MSDTQKRKSIQVQLDQLDPPEWIAEMRRHFAEHGTLRPDHVAMLQGKRSTAAGLLSQPKDSMASVFQKMAPKPRK